VKCGEVAVADAAVDHIAVVAVPDAAAVPVFCRLGLLTLLLQLLFLIFLMLILILLPLLLSLLLSLCCRC
jgi:hypothetical protein